MSDLKEYFQDWREHRLEAKRRRQSFANDAFKLLIESPFDYVMLSPGHYRIESEFDYWPSTGTWMELASRKKGHGIKRLLRVLAERRPELAHDFNFTLNTNWRKP